MSRIMWFSPENVDFYTCFRSDKIATITSEKIYFLIQCASLALRVRKPVPRFHVPCLAPRIISRPTAECRAAPRRSLVPATKC